MYVARMDYQDIQQRKLTKSTEMFWAPSPSMPNQGGVLGFLPYWLVLAAAQIATRARRRSLTLFSSLLNPFCDAGTTRPAALISAGTTQRSR